MGFITGIKGHCVDAQMFQRIRPQFRTAQIVSTRQPTTCSPLRCLRPLRLASQLSVPPLLRGAMGMHCCWMHDV